MLHPVDYKITVREDSFKAVGGQTNAAGQKIFIFRMFEGGCKSPMSKDDYADIVRQLFLACCEGEGAVVVVKRMPEPLQSAPDLIRYDVVSKLGSDKLRRIAATQTGRVSSWFNQEAGLLEIQD